MAKFCEQCGAELNETANFCPKCGFKVSPDAVIPSQAEAEPVTSVTDTKQTKSTANIKYIIIAVAVVLALAVSVYFFSSASAPLIGDNLTAYNIIVASSHNFKNPASVRLVSGTVSSDDTTLFCALTAENSFGGSGTEFYWLFDGKAYKLKDIGETPGILEKSTDSLNISGINKHLAEHFS